MQFKPKVVNLVIQKRLMSQTIFTVNLLAVGTQLGGEEQRMPPSRSL